MGDKQNETQTTRRRNWGDPPLDDKQDEPGLKWYHIQPMWVKLTAEYVGGIIAGFGIGLGIRDAFVGWSLLQPLSLMLVMFGIATAYGAQRERAMREEFQKKREESSTTK